MTQTEPELEQLGDYLLEKKEALLYKFQQLAKQNDQLSTLNITSRKEFYNSIPDFIAHLSKQLKGEESSAAEVTKKHGSNRWKLNLDLREVLEEWGLLNSVIMEEINQASRSISISCETSKKAQYEVSLQIYEGIKLSVNEYYNSQRMEAQAQIADMRETIGKYNEHSGLQLKSLRQASHDLGGSVALIQMNLHLLKQQNLPPEAGELLDKVLLSSENLVKLFKSMLDLFRLEAGEEKLEITEFNVAEVLDDLCKDMNSLAVEKGIKLSVNGEKPLRVRGDKMKIRRIAQNLLMNSIKYTEKGSTKIAWERAPENHWRLTISDTGPGLDATHASVFAETDDSADHSEDKGHSVQKNPDEVQSHGEGIGLTIVRRLCRMLYGVIDVETSPGKGTLFRIMLPADYE